MQFPVPLRPPGTCHSRVILSQELLVKSARQDAEDLAGAWGNSPAMVPLTR